MEYGFVILMGILLFWAVFCIGNYAEQKKKEDLEKKETSGLKVSMPSVEKSKAEKAEIYVGTQESLDALYARSHGMWICRCCETINDGGAIRCSACGVKK